MQTKLKEVNFLTEFCKRWNEKKSNITTGDKRHDSILMLDKYPVKDNQKVNVEKYGRPNDHLIQVPLNDYIKEKHNQDECSGFIDGFKACQALQSTVGYSLEDVRNKLSPLKNLIALLKRESPIFSIDERIQDLIEKEIEQSEKSIEYLQSLTPQPKGEEKTFPKSDAELKDEAFERNYVEPKADIVIEVEMEEVHNTYFDGSPNAGRITQRIKLTNGQPTLIFK